jgi:hypothetical protein
MNETIVDEELIGTQFILEQEEEEEKDEVFHEYLTFGLIPKCTCRFSFFYFVYFFGGLECVGSPVPKSPILYQEMSGLEPRKLQ